MQMKRGNETKKKEGERKIEKKISTSILERFAISGGGRRTAHK